MKSKILVFVQFAMILIMTLPFGTPAVYFEYGLFFIVLGALIGIAALLENRLGNFNIRPDIKEDCVLIKDGIYAYIRHPMYTSVLTIMFGVMVMYFSTFEIVAFGILFINLLIKMFYEESLWHCHSDEYVEYTKNTSRLIPKVF
ncbi:MAG: isoprenylcysteine carboxylmethyltransferase family protein [Sulfurimonas sp.]|nr:isoprenylcysteine carboxylmethyltransferase family protein [Sulfurimonas sp.]